MRDHRQPAGAVNRGDRLRERPQRGQRLVDPEREQVPRARRQLDAGHELEAVAPLRVQLAGDQRALDVVVVRDCEHVEVRAFLGVVEERARIRHPVAVRGVQL